MTTSTIFMETPQSWLYGSRLYTTQEVEQKVCDYFELPYERLKIKSRKRDIVKVRQVISYILHKKKGIACTRVGWLFNQDHSTVLDACQKVADDMYTDPAFHAQVTEIDTMLAGWRVRDDIEMPADYEKIQFKNMQRRWRRRAKASLNK